MHRMMNLAKGSEEKFMRITEGISNIEEDLMKMDNNNEQSKIQELESFIGSTIPQKIEILPPKHVNTKGSGKRIKGGKEKSMEQQQKKPRLCKMCNKMEYHDSRNCPTKTSS